MKVYGIPNCDTVKKAIRWLQDNKVKYEFHDFKKEGIERKVLQQWSKEVGWEKLLNRKGTTWRKLSPEQQQVSDENTAIALLIEKPSLIKRPVIEKDGKITVGFDTTVFTNAFKTSHSK